MKYWIIHSQDMLNLLLWLLLLLCVCVCVCVCLHSDVIYVCRLCCVLLALSAAANDWCVHYQCRRLHSSVGAPLQLYRPRYSPPLPTLPSLHPFYLHLPSASTFILLSSIPSPPCTSPSCPFYFYSHYLQLFSLPPLLTHTCTRTHAHTHTHTHTHTRQVWWGWLSPTPSPSTASSHKW